MITFNKELISIITIQQNTYITVSVKTTKIWQKNFGSYLTWLFLDKNQTIMSSTTKLNICGANGYTIFKSNFQRKFPNWNVN